MKPLVLPCVVPLTISGRWTVYAFAEGQTPTDERGILLGAEELGQLVEIQTAAIHAMLDDARSKLAAADAELTLLREANAERLQNELVAGMKGK